MKDKFNTKLYDDSGSSGSGSTLLRIDPAGLDQASTAYDDAAKEFLKALTGSENGVVSDASNFGGVLGQINSLNQYWKDASFDDFKNKSVEIAEKLKGMAQTLQKNNENLKKIANSAKTIHQNMNADISQILNGGGN